LRDGALTPTLLELSPGAKQDWIAYHDAIEQELASGGELYDVRDVASKSADNAARLAALFQLFERGISPIDEDIFESASRIAAWHLSESRRFFGEIALPPEMADAARLDAWLIGYCREKKASFVGKNHLRQYGPIRDGKRLDAALKELSEAYRVQSVKSGKRTLVLLNPDLWR
jgi:putative DNA primase/helicase